MKSPEGVGSPRSPGSPTGDRCAKKKVEFKGRKFEMALRRQFYSHKCTLLKKYLDLSFYASFESEIKFYV